MLSIHQLIHKPYNSFSNKTIKPRSQFTSVQTNAQDDIIKVRPNPGKVTHPRIYTVRDVNTELGTLSFYQIDGIFSLVTGEKLNCSHRDINWYGWKIYPLIEV